MSESAFSADVRVIISNHGHCSMIESPLVTPGFPDLNYCIDGVEGNIELKWSGLGGVPEIRPAQRIWFKHRNVEGGRTWIYAKVKQGITQGYFYLLIRGKYIKELAEAKHLDEWVKLALYKSHKIDKSFINLIAEP